MEPLQTPHIIALIEAELHSMLKKVVCGEISNSRASIH